MKQRVQSIFFFLSALILGGMFFMPIASYLDEYGTYYKLFIHEVDIVSVAPNATVSFSSIYTLPLLILTVAVILINFYISMSIFRAVKLQQFIKLFKLSRISVAILVVLIATIFAAAPSFRWPAFGAFLPLVALIMMLVASAGLRKDIKKVQSVDRIR